MLVLLAAPAAVHGQGSDRSRRLASLTCASQVARRDITLFANGTVRLREWQAPASEVEASDLGLGFADGGDGREPLLALGELSQEELEAVQFRLRDEDLGESEERDSGQLLGEWVEVCRLELRLDGQPAKDLSFNRYETLSLGTSRVVETLLELAQETEEEVASERAFPKNYRPKPGDVLERSDGARFEVIRFTDDGEGVELRGKTQPLTLYVARTDLQAEFRRVVSRR